MKYRMLALFLLLQLTAFASAQDARQLRVDGASVALVKETNSYYSQGKYRKAIETLKQLEAAEDDNQAKGVIIYWQALCHKKLMALKASAVEFERARELGHSARDFSYEYAQVLFGLERFKDAELEFKKSLAVGFKPAVSLYYLGTIAKEGGDTKTAAQYLSQIKTSSDPEAKDVLQPAEFLIGDVYSDEAMGKTKQRELVEKIVIPQYEAALEIDKKSILAPEIQQKIRKLKMDNELALYQLINGRPVAEKRHYVKLSQELSQDSNVTFSPANTTVEKSKQASSYSKTDVFGRYTFYYKNFLSLAPGVRFNKTHYFNRVPEIYRNDNQLISGLLNTAYEHKFLKKPASLLLDYDFTETKRDVYVRKKLDFSSRTHTLSLGESFSAFNFGDTIVRMRQRMLESYLDGSDSKTLSLVAEQFLKVKDHFLVFMMSYDRTRVDSNVFDTDSLLLRTDYFGPTWKGWLTPSAGFGFSLTDPINNRDARGLETLVNPSVRLSNNPLPGLRVSLKADYQNYQSEDEDNFAYTKTVYGIELDYIF